MAQDALWAQDLRPYAHVINPFNRRTDLTKFRGPVSWDGKPHLKALPPFLQM